MGIDALHRGLWKRLEKDGTDEGGGSGDWFVERDWFRAEGVCLERGPVRECVGKIEADERVFWGGEGELKSIGLGTEGEDSGLQEII